ncbi:MAG: zinc-ribbon domain [Acidobacteriota bacterium]|nr:zinc-ribbon domain [Acidobacteriota bacterium]
MFCPKCGTENAEGASFCRGCGSNISLVPQALTGTLRDPEARDGTRRLSRHERRELERERRRERKRKKPPSLEGAVVPFFGGIGFFLVGIVIMMFMPGGAEWGFWMFIPAFFMIGSGVSEYLRLQQAQKAAPTFPAYTPPTAMPPTTSRAAELRPSRPTTEIHTPGSVTEGTTKLLDPDQ